MAQEPINEKTITDLAKESWGRLNQLWADFGHPEEGLARRRAFVHKHMTDLFSDMIIEEEKRFQEKKVALEEKRDVYEKLCRLLKKDIGLQDQLPLTKYEQELEETTAQLEEERKKKMAKYDEVRAKEKVLLAVLEEEEVNLDLGEDEMPGDAEVKKIRDHISLLEKTRLNRIAEFARLKQDLDSHFECLGMLPENGTLERVVFIADLESPPNLSRAWLDKVVELNESYKMKVEKASIMAQTYRARIGALCHRLKISMTEELTQDFKLVTLEKLRAEVSRLEDLKKENMVTFISQIRDELTAQWEKCMVRPEFSPLEETQNFDDELLEQHESELAKWEEYYSKNEPIFEMIAKRSELWERFCELELKSEDPGRLNNRGGALLREEKEKKEAKAQCFRFKKQLLAMAKTFQEETGEPLMIYEENLEGMFQREEDQLQANLEEARITRKNQKEEMAGNKTQIRKRPATPSKGGLTPAKRGKPNASTAKSPFPMPVMSRTPAGKILRGTRTATSNKPPPPAAKNDGNLSPASTYSEFQNHLMCQSTLNSSRANPLSNVNGPAATASPKKKAQPLLFTTPAKDFNQQF